MVTEQVVLTSSIADIAAPQSRHGVYSNNFQLPMTNINRSIFSNAHLVGAITCKPFEIMPAFADVGGIPVLEGQASLVSAKGHTRLVIAAGNADVYTPA